MNVPPYLYFDGNCEEAFEYYADLLGGDPQSDELDEADRLIAEAIDVCGEHDDPGIESDCLTDTDHEMNISPASSARRTSGVEVDPKI